MDSCSKTGGIHKAGDIEALRNISPEQINAIMKKASPAVVDILARTVWALCRKMNLPESEAEIYVRSVKEGKMGYLFENMEKMDIQEERRKTAEARQEADKARQEAAHLGSFRFLHTRAAQADRGERTPLSEYSFRKPVYFPDTDS